MMTASARASLGSQYTYIRMFRRSVPLFGFLTFSFALIGVLANALGRSYYLDAHTTPFTALGLMVLGLSLMTHRPLQVSPPWKFVLGFLVVGLCLGRVVEGMFFDTKLIVTLLSPAPGGVFEGSFGFESALLIGALISAGMLRRHRGPWGEAFGLVAFGCLIFAALQQLFAVHFFGAHTAPFSLLAELAATIGILGLYSTRPYLRVMFRRSWIGFQARVLAVVVFSVPIISAEIVVVSARPPNHTLESLILTIMGQILVLLVVVMFVSNRHERSDQARRRSERRLHELYRTDVLTGVANRQGALEGLEAAWKAYLNDGAQFSVMLVDLDHFKRINDTFGHQTGDDVLKLVGDMLKQSVRAEDMVGRWGGEEFVILIRRRKGEPVLDIAERLCAQIATIPHVASAQSQIKMPVTASVGVSEFLPRDGSFDDALERADQSLYVAKANGRNQVVNNSDVAA